MASPVGRLWVVVDSDIRPALGKLRLLDHQAEKTARSLNSIGQKVNPSGLIEAQTKMRGVEASAKSAAKATEGIGRSAQRATSPMKNLQAATYRLSQSFINLRYGNPLGVAAGLGQAFTSLAAAARGAGVGIGALSGGLGAVATAGAVVVAALGAAGAAIAGFGVSQAADLELLKIQYEGLMGSASRAAQEVSFLQSLAQESIVPTDQLLEANRQLLAFGITTDSVRRDLVQFMADYGSAAGLTTSQVQGLAYVIGQINAQGKAYTQDIRQLANASVGVDKLAKALGMTTGEFQNLVRSGKATSDVIIPAILKIGEGSAEAAEKARNSARGIIANLKDIAKVKVGAAFTSLLEQLKPILLWVQDFIKAFDFAQVARAFGNVVDYIKQALSGVDAGAADTATSISTAIANTVNLLGYALAQVIRVGRVVFDVLSAVFNFLWQVIQNAVAEILSGIALAAKAASYIPGPWQDAANEVSASSYRMAQEAAAGAAIAEGAWRTAAGNIATDFGSLFTTSIPFMSVKATSKERDGWANTLKANPIPEPSLPGGPSDGKDKAAQKRWQNWLKFMRELVNGFKDALKELQGLTRQFIPGELSKIQQAFRFDPETMQGDVSGIISMFDNLEEAVKKYYRVFASPSAAGKTAAKRAAAERDALLSNLRSQAQELVRLARENERLSNELDQWRKDEGKRVQGQIDALNNQYNEYVNAQGYAVKGLIQRAQDALDAATEAYDRANEKLQDLLDARAQFLSSLADSARSFVNALVDSNETIQRFTRLDSAGSFLVEEEKKTAAFRDQMRQRLDTLRQWSANVKALIAKGLDASLLKDLVAQGPEAAGAVVAELANATTDQIAEINGLQGQLSSVIGDLQQEASRQWFDAGIAQQQQAVAGLAAAKAQAEQALLDIQAQYNVKLAALEAYQKSVEEGTDEHSKALTALMKKNDEAAAVIADGIQKKFEFLTDEKNPKNMAILGQGAMDGLIKGMEDKETLVVATAQRIADKVRSTIQSALRISSPSKVMEEIGGYVGEGLARGMDSSLSRVEQSSFRMAGVTLPSIGEIAPPAAAQVRVFIGETELTDIVDTRISYSDARSLDFVSAGRRG